MKVNPKAAAPKAAAPSPSVNAVSAKQAPAAKKSSTVAAKVADVTKKVVSLLYRLLEGSWMYAPCVRKEDLRENPFVKEFDKSGAATNAVLVVGSRYGQCVSVGPVTPRKVAVLGDGHGLDLTKFIQAKVLTLKDAVALARKTGKACTIRMKAANKTFSGHLVGNLDQMYVWFCSSKGELMSLDTKRISDGRNKDRLFELVSAE